MSEVRNVTIIFIALIASKCCCQCKMVCSVSNSHICCVDSIWIGVSDIETNSFMIYHFHFLIINYILSEMKLHDYKWIRIYHDISWGVFFLVVIYRHAGNDDIYIACNVRIIYRFNLILREREIFVCHCMQGAPFI